jgi:hypothetical protein
MEQSVEHGVSHRGIGEEPLPFTRWHEACNQGVVGLSPIVDHLKEVVLGLAFKGADAPIDQDEKISPDEPGKRLQVTPVRAGRPEFEARRGSRQAPWQ